MFRTCIAFAAFALLITAPAHAQSKKELAAQNAALAQRVSVLESRLLTGDPAAERLMQRVDALETSQRTLTGEVERLRYERDTLLAELKALTSDLREMQELSTRMQIHLDAVDHVAGGRGNPYGAPQPYESAPAGPNYTGGEPYGNPDAGQPIAIPGPPSVSERTIPVQEQYNELSQLPSIGKRRLAEGDFAGAQQAFRDYLGGFPDAPDAGEINYWLGETYYVRGGYASAAESYIASMRKAPQGIKAPDAMIRLGAALRELGKTAEACQTLNSFPAQYPNAPQNVKDKARTELIRTGC